MVSCYGSALWSPALQLDGDITLAACVGAPPPLTSHPRRMRAAASTACGLSRPLPGPSACAGCSCPPGPRARLASNNPIRAPRAVLPSAAALRALPCHRFYMGSERGFDGRVPPPPAGARCRPAWQRFHLSSSGAPDGGVPRPERCRKTHDTEPVLCPAPARLGSSSCPPTAQRTCLGGARGPRPNTYLNMCMRTFAGAPSRTFARLLRMFVRALPSWNRPTALCR